MLPGLQIFDLYELIQCEILSSIENDFSNGKVRPISYYRSGKCNSECNDHHLVVYLENVLYRGYRLGPQDISKLLTHENSKVRKLSLLICYGHFLGVRVPCFLQEDPSCSVREIYLTQSRELNIPVLIKQTRDENPGIKLMALRRLMKFKDDLNFKMLIFRAVCSAINDRMISVRTYASEAIGEFENLPDSIIERLLNKKTDECDEKELSGALVYGIEDEYLEVRINTIKSLYSLTTVGVVSKVFEFLVDSLNDENESLRELCSYYLKSLSKKYALSVEQEIINQVCGSLEENNHNLKNNVLDLLSNLLYESVEVFDMLVFQINRNVEERRVFVCIKKIVAKNGKLFFLNIRKFYEHSCIAKVESSLKDCSYIARLVVLRELRRKGFDFKLSHMIEDHFLFLEIMESSVSKVGCKPGSGFLKDILLQELREKKAGANVGRYYKRLFREGCKREESSYRFVCYLHRGILQWLDKGSDKLLQRIPHLFTNTNFSISTIHEMDAIIKYVEGLDLEPIKALKYRIVVQSNIKLAYGMPIKFPIHVGAEKGFANLAIKLTSQNRSALYLPVRKKVDICIFEENISVLHCWIVKLVDDKEIQLSPAKTVLIDKA